MDEVLEKLTTHPDEHKHATSKMYRGARSNAGLYGPAFRVVRRAFPIFEATSRLDVSVRESLYRRYLGTSDCFMALLALSIVATAFDRELGIASLLCGPLLVLMHKMAGLYERDALVLRQSTLDEVPTLVQLAGIFTLMVTVLQPLLLRDPFSYLHVGALWLLSSMLVVAGRTLARRLASARSTVERCLVIGGGDHAKRISEKLISSGLRARVVATLPLAGDDTRAIGGPDQLRRIVREHDVHRVIIAPVSNNSSAMVELIRITKAVGVRVSVLPRIFEVVGSSVEVEDINGLNMLGVRRFGLTRSSHLLKRAFDLIGSTLILAAIAPAMLMIALAIKLDSSGPVFFRQTRVGRDGKHFQIIKFRSMTPDAEARKDLLRELNEAGDGLFKIASDPRITRVGRFLRRTSLDELPQLFNVVRGEMSLVGPRPLVLDEDAQVHGLDRSRLHLTPGMTGPWQVLGSTRIPMNEMVGIDYLYVADWTLWTDVKILVRTIGHVFSRKGL